MVIAIYPVILSEAKACPERSRRDHVISLRQEIPVRQELAPDPQSVVRKATP